MSMHLPLGRIAVAMGLLGHFGLHSVADDQPDRLVGGSSVTWMTPGEGMSGRFTTQVIHVSDDFNLQYDPANDDDFGDEFSAYGVEFQGVLYFSCSDDLPSQASQQQLKALPSLSTGQSLTLADEQITITVGEESTSYINGLGEVDLRQYDITWPSDDETLVTEDETVWTSTAYGLTVRVVYDAEYETVVVGAVIPETSKPLSLRHSVSLENCETLLTDAAN